MRICFVCIIAFMAGCIQEASTPVEVEQTLQPKGTITGLINNKATQKPVAGAVFYLGFNGSVQSATSDSAGAFSIANVPVGQYKIVNGNAVFSGQYTLTVSLVNYNISQSDSLKRYRDYYYDTVTIAFTAIDSLAVSNMAGSVRLQISYLNTKVLGQVVDQNMQPVANAAVTLFDATMNPNIALAQTNTSASGIFQFTQVDNGLTINIKAVSSDGSLAGSLPNPITLPLNVTVDSLRSQVSTERIMLGPVDNVSPYVIGITPQNNSNVVPSNLQIVYTFSEPIKQTAYTRTDLPAGQNTIIDGILINYSALNGSAGAISFSAQWNSTFTQLMITPQEVIGSAHYTVDMRTAFNSGNISDLASNKLVNDTSIIGDFEVLNFTTNGGSLAPAAPTLLRRIVQGLYGQLDYSGGVVGLEWNNVANAQSYNLYRSVDNGAFELLHKNVFSLQDTNKIASLCFPPTGNNPLSSISVSYQVHSVSADLVESPTSNTVTITDSVPPALLSASITSGTGSASSHWWNYTLQFSEPLNISNAETVTNYTILNPDSTFVITQASYIGYNASSGHYVVQLLISTYYAAPAGYSINVQNGVTDLAGNSISTNANTITLSAPPIPVLSNPINGSTALGLPDTLIWNASNGATSYRLQVSSNPGFTAIVFDSSNLPNPINSTSEVVSSANLTAGTTYYWRVSASNNAGTSGYSATWRFQP